MQKTAPDIMRMIQNQGIQMVDFKMVDINGQFRHVTIPAQHFSEETMVNGIGFDASNYGYAVVEKSDMVFVPDPDTAVVDPFCDVPTLSMTGNAMVIGYPENPSGSVSPEHCSGRRAVHAGHRRCRYHADSS